MRILGIVAEYDPFHNGHLHHLREARKAVSPDWVYAVISPCVRQRGDLALLSPSDRALCAVSAGADAVFALPALWTVRDAEHYAAGAISLLARLGITHLAFGAETGDLPLLRRAAEMLESPVPVFSSLLKERLAGGAGYPAALSSALSAALPEAKGLLDRPNNILAVCYLRAIMRLRLKVEPVVIPRTGNYHAAFPDPAAPSASSLRDCLLRGNYAAAYAAVPPYTEAILRRRFLEGRIPDEGILDALLLSRLRSLSAGDLRALPDVSEGLENRLAEEAALARTRGQLIAALSGRRYPAARVRRLCAAVLLGVTRDTLDSLPLPDSALLLALRKNPEMTALWKDLPLPVISSFSEWKKTARPEELAAWSLWAQCCRLPDTLPMPEKLFSVE